MVENKQRMFPPKKRRGFSLAELMVVIVILGLLATIVVPNVMGYLFKGQGARVKADITTLMSGLDSYAVMNGGRYPESLDELVTPDENGHTFIRAKSVPLDPWKSEYQYEPPSSGEPEPRVFSYGKDGQPGGEGENADIDNESIRE